jgi:multiple sugar transport system permease protein
VTTTDTGLRRARPRPGAPAPPLPPGRSPRRAGDLRRDGAYGYLFVAPQLLGFGVFLLVPLLSVFWFSLQDYNTFTGEMTFAGLDNYRSLVDDGTFATVMGNTALFSLGVIPANIVLGIALAVLVDRQLPGIAVFRTAFFVPVVISLVAWSLIWEFLLQDNGGVNAALAAVGIDGPNWLEDPRWALVAVIVVQVFKEVGISMVLFLAALQAVPREVLEAARLDGASAWRTLRHVTLPLISPTVLLVSVLATISTLKAFAQVFLLTEGGPGLSTAVLGYYIYDQAFNAFQVGTASTLAVVLFAIVLGLTVLQWWTRTRWVVDES